MLIHGSKRAQVIAREASSTKDAANVGPKRDSPAGQYSEAWTTGPPFVQMTFTETFFE